MIGRLIHYGKSRPAACRNVVLLSKDGRIGIMIAHLRSVHGQTIESAANKVAKMSETELVRAAAAAKGLKLVTSATNVTGFKNVNNDKCGGYFVHIRKNGIVCHLCSNFATPEEAALYYASYIEVERAAAVEPLTADEAGAVAAAKGLQLVTSATSGTGFKYVYKSANGMYEARTRDKSTGTRSYLGSFTTPWEAALCLAKKNRVHVSLGAGTSNSAHDTAYDDDAGDEKGGEKKQRFVWSKEENQRFYKVVHDLGIDSATPQKIAEELARLAPDATRLPTYSNISSHLQKYRLLLAKQRDEGDTRSASVSAPVRRPKGRMFE